VLALAAAGPTPGFAASRPRCVRINGTRLADATLRGLEQRYRIQIPNGSYWYDGLCGAWGREGGPTLGFTLTGLALGGPLRANASRGDTRVFVNGRELHRRDVAALVQLLREPIRRGRYWMDAQGNAGREGGPALVNLFQLARSAGRGRGGAWNVHTRVTDAHVGGDGRGFLFYIDRDTGWTPD
jgi:hypothetical protein